MSRLIDADALNEHKFVGNKFVQIGGRTNGKTLESVNRAYQQGWNDAIDAIIDNAPTVEERPKGEWIPVTERLPEEEGDYLLWGKIDENEEDEYSFIGSYDEGFEQFGIWHEQFDSRTLGSLGSEFYAYSKVVAWQPLPKPYKER